MSKSNWRPLNFSHKLQRILWACGKSGWKFMSQMFCMRLGSRALRASLHFKCSNMCSLPDVHLSCVQRHINTCVLFHPRGRNSALVEPFKPSERCTSENKYRRVFVKAARVNVGRWIQKSLFVRSQKAEQPSSASRDHPLPCGSAAYLTTTKKALMLRTGVLN